MLSLPPSVPPSLPAHDAGVVPWIAVALYLLASLLCLRQATNASQRRETLFWAAAALVMLALGINKQLDLQTSLTATLRAMARADGWYAQRRAWQALFVMVAGLGSLLLLVMAGWLVRGLRPAVWLALAGLSLLALFVLVRVASFHHVDVLLRAPVLGLKLHVLLELLGIMLVGLAALLPGAARPAAGRG